MAKILLPLMFLAVFLIECRAESQISECREANETTYAVAAMAEFPAIYDTLREVYSTVTSFPVVAKCAESVASLANFEEMVKTQAQSMSSAAKSVDKTVKDAGIKKAHQGEAARQASCVWQELKLIYHTQQAMLRALDNGIKDTLLIRAEQIGGEIRNETKDWTIATVKEELEFEMSDVRVIANALPPAIKDVIGPVIEEIIQNNIATQLITALMRSPLEASLDTDTNVQARWPYTEYGISKGLKRVASVRQMVLTTGLDTADAYSESTDKTIQGTETVQNNMNEISVQMECEEVEATATQSLAKLKELQTGIETNEVPKADQAKEEIEKNDAEVITNVMFAATDGKGGLKATVTAFLKTLPQDSKRSSLIQQAASTISMSSVQPTMEVEDLMDLLKQADPQLTALTKAFLCYVKILDVIGGVCKRCKEGIADFEGIYQQVSSESNIDEDKCLEEANIRTPSKQEIKQTLQTVAQALKFNPDCSSNRQRDSPRRARKMKLKFQDEDAFFSSVISKIVSFLTSGKPWLSKELDTQQKFFVCLYRKMNMNDAKIAKKLDVKEKQVKEVECSDVMTKRERHQRDQGEL